MLFVWEVAWAYWFGFLQDLGGGAMRYAVIVWWWVDSYLCVRVCVRAYARPSYIIYICHVHTCVNVNIYGRFRLRAYLSPPLPLPLPLGSIYSDPNLCPPCEPVET